MASIATGAACCAAQAGCLTCTAITSCCCSRSIKTSRRATKVFYLMIVVLSVLAALLLRFYGDEMFVKLYSFKVGCTDSGSGKCYGDQAVYRISFALAAFFVVMMMGSVSDQFNRSFWGMKVVIYLLMVVGCFFIPNPFFTTYASVSQVVSIVFLLLMVIILVDFAHSVQEYLTGKGQEYSAEMVKSGYEEPGVCQNSWFLLYLTSAFFLGCATFAGLGAMYAFSAKHDGCGGTMANLSLTLIVGLVLTILSTLDVFGGRGLLPPLVVWSYCTYMVWGAMSANPEGCNPMTATEDSPVQIVIGLVITAFSLTYTAYSAASSVPSLCGGADDEGLSQSLLDKEKDADEDEEKGSDGGDSDSEARRLKSSADDEEDAGSKGAWVFHLIMCTAAIYMAMLLTDWGADVGGAASVAKQGMSKTTMTVKVVCEWATFGLYAWTLFAPIVAPRCCPDRSFD